MDYRPRDRSPQVHQRLRLPEALANAAGLREVYEQLLALPSLGPFLAYQYAIDLAYSPVVNADEMEFVMPGPGALDGISKCFLDTAGLGPALHPPLRDR
ncbi:MAG: nucleotide kinase domain-containing protein [Pseudonocardiaceae bacterium]